MVKEQLYEPYSISVETGDQHKPVKRQTAFFELVYILTGTGQQTINNSVLAYEQGYVFLLTPQDTHCLNIKTKTTFFSLRFNNICLKSKGIMKDNVQRLESILQNTNQRPRAIMEEATDRPLVRNIIDTLILEQQNDDVCWVKLKLHLINTLLVIIGRNIKKTQPDTTINKEERLQDILQYIQENIYSPKQLQADNISKVFGISLTYLSRYFKKHTGKTMLDYISAYKTKLIENRLLHSAMRISEIADEFSFSDESHLNKFFKKQLGMNPTEYRRLESTEKG
jgi:AraC-like DNA-binding protein